MASFQSSTVSGPSLFRFGTKRFEGNELSSCLQFANFWFHSRCEMATSKGSPTRTSKALCSKLLAPTFLPPISLAPQVQIKFWISEIHAFQILRKLWGLSFPTLSWSSRTWRSISHLRFRWEVVESKQFICTMDIEIICLTNVNQNPSNRFWTTKMCEGGSERQTINLPPGEHLWLGSNELLFQGQAFHLHNADEAWWWLEPDPGAGIMS